MEAKLKILKKDAWLEPYSMAINGRHRHYLDKKNELTGNGEKTLSEFATGYLYFGLRRISKGWAFREWAPHATEIYLIGDFNNWKESEKFKLKRITESGNWELILPPSTIKHGDLY